MSTISIPCPACGSPLKIRDRSLLGRRGKCPKCNHSFVLEESDEVTLELAEAPLPQAGSAAVWIPDGGAAPAPANRPVVVSAPAADVPFVAPAETTGVGRLRELRRQQAKRRWVSLAIGLVVVAASVGTGYVVFVQGSQPAGPTTVAAGPSPRAGDQSGGGAGETIDRSVSASPTAGGPIPLEMIPAGTRMLLHLRPSELWQPGSLGEEFRFCLGPVGTFLEQAIKTHCRKPPEEIEELLFAWIPAQRGTPPELTMVVRLKHEARKSELLELLGGERVETDGRAMYVNNGRAALILDLKTYAVGPASMAEEMVSSIGGQSPLPAGVEDLIAKSDRRRHMTLLFEPTAVLLDKEFLAPAAGIPLLSEAMDWFGDDAETVLWSLHLDPDRFYSEVLVRSQSGIRPAGLERELKARLDQLPEKLVAAVRYMQPAEMGKRQLIGRVPAMAKVVSLATLTEQEGRHVKLITPLPDRAGPNLALGTLLAWDESTRTDFSRELAPPSTTPASTMPATLAERLKQKIDVDFRRTPLQEAFAFIADEVKVTIDIDGDALKLSGYTQNMPQTFAFEQIPATQAIQEILKNYDKMCLIVDEANKLVLVSTYPVAEQRGQIPFKLTP
jgi:hypothetical protein